jgi:alcohol dehydrogenase (cytochrome c)
VGTAESWGGVLSTDGGLVFFGDDSGAFAAVDAKTGRPLWHFHLNAGWKASPMTYRVGGRQYVAVASGSQIVAFGLPTVPLRWKKGLMERSATAGQRSGR